MADKINTKDDKPAKKRKAFSRILSKIPAPLPGSSAKLLGGVSKILSGVAKKTKR